MFDKLKKKFASKVVGPEEGKKLAAFSPLGLRLGGKFEVKNNTYFIHKSVCKTMREPYSILAVGKFSMGGSTVYRFYTGECGELSPGTSFLQCICDGEEIQEIRMFDTVTQHFPCSEAEWYEWINAEGSKIGLITTELNDKEYGRVEAWAAPNAEYEPPISFTETLSSVDHTDSKHATHLNHEAMLYGAWLNEELDIAEYVLLTSMEWHDAEDELRSGIVIYAGIDLVQAEIEVLF